MVALVLLCLLQANDEQPGLTTSDFLFTPTRKSIALLETEAQSLTSLFRVTPKDAKDYPKLAFRLAESQIELHGGYLARSREAARDGLLAGNPEKAEILDKAAAEARFKAEEKRFSGVLYCRMVTDDPKYKEFPRLEAALFAHAYLLDRGPDPAAGDKMVQRLLAEFPQSPLIPQALLSRGEAYFDKGDYDQASAWYEKCAGAGASGFADYARYKQAWGLLRKKETGKALEMFVEAAGKERPRVQLQSALDAMLAFTMLPDPTAKDAVQLARKLSPGNPRPLLQRASDRFKQLGLSSAHKDVEAEIATLPPPSDPKK